MLYNVLVKGIGDRMPAGSGQEGLEVLIAHGGEFVRPGVAGYGVQANDQGLFFTGDRISRRRGDKLVADTRIGVRATSDAKNTGQQGEDRLHGGAVYR